MAAHDGLRITTAFEDDAFVLAVYGEVDLATVGELRSAAAAATDSGRPRVVLDLGACHFMDSVGMGAVVGLHRRTKAAGQELEILPGGAAVTRAFAITGLDRVLPFAGG